MGRKKNRHAVSSGWLRFVSHKKYFVCAFVFHFKEKVVLIQANKSFPGEIYYPPQCSSSLMMRYNSYKNIFLTKFQIYVCFIIEQKKNKIQKKNLHKNHSKND